MVVEPGTEPPDGPAAGRDRVRGPGEDPDGDFAALVGRFAAALDDGSDAADAFRSSLAEEGWTAGRRRLTDRTQAEAASGTIRAGPSCRTSLTSRLTAWTRRSTDLVRLEQADELVETRRRPAPASDAQASSGTITGIRSCRSASDLVRGRGHDREGPADGVGRGVVPAGPQPGQRERPAADLVDQVRLTDGPFALPLVERVHRHQAAPPPEGLTKGRAGRQRLGPGVEHARADLRVGRPVRDQPPAVGGHRPTVVALHDDERLVGRGDVVVAARVVDERLGPEDLGQLRDRALLGEPSAHASKSSIVRAMDETRPPSPAPDPGVGGPLTRDDALALLDRAARAARPSATSRRPVSTTPGSSASTIRRSPRRRSSGSARSATGSTTRPRRSRPGRPSSASARRRRPTRPGGTSPRRGSGPASCGAPSTPTERRTKRAPREDKAEIANRLGWLTKETGDPRAARRYFAAGRGDSPLLTVTLALIAVTSIISLTAQWADDPSLYLNLELDKLARGGRGVLATLDGDPGPWIVPR